MRVDKSNKEPISKANTQSAGSQKKSNPKVQKSEAPKAKTKKLETEELHGVSFKFDNETLAKFGAEFFAARKRNKDKVSADDLINEIKPKRKRLSMAKQKKGYEHVTKDVPKDERLSDKKLLALGKMSISKVQRWAKAPYAWNFRRALSRRE